MSDRVFKCIILKKDLSCWNCSDIWYCSYRFFGSKDSEVSEIVRQFLNGDSLNKQLLYALQHVVRQEVVKSNNGKPSECLTSTTRALHRLYYP